MPKADDTPVNLRPYLAHGCEVVSPWTSTEAFTTCPFCGKGKFFVKLDTGQWTCYPCAKSGNVYTFFGLLHSLSYERTTRDQYEWLIDKRGLPYESLRAIGACLSLATEEWIVPQYGPSGGIVNLDRYRYLRGEKKYRLMATPGTEEVQTGVYAVANSLDGDGGPLVVCEGAWNLAAYHACRQTVDLGWAALIAVPGCMHWKEGWGKFTAAHDVTLLFDNDHPQTNPDTGHVNTKAFAGVERTTRLMHQFSTPPKSVMYLNWGTGTEYHEPDLPDGFDLNDAYKQFGPETLLTCVRDRIRPTPPEWKESERASSVIVPDTCTSWDQLNEACEEAFEWTPTHKGGMAFALAVAASVKIKGDQLWGKLMGPGGCGKTTILSGPAVARQFVLSESFINGLYSRQGTGTADYSMAARLFDKCLMIKEGDTLLRADNRGTLLAELRDLYDGTGGKTFKTTSKKYEGLRFTVLIAGTGALRELDGAQLGGRFLDYYMPRLSERLQRSMILKAIRQQDSDSREETGVTVESVMSKGYLKFVKRAAGYLIHLRECLVRKMKDLPRVDDATAERLWQLAEFVAPTRAKPSYTQEDLSEVENPVRLARQLTKLMQVLTVVLGKGEYDEYVMGLVKKVAMDTSAGRTLQLANVMAPRQDEGVEARDCAKFTATTPDNAHHYLLFLSKIGVVEQYETEGPKVHRRTKWRLTDPYFKLYNAVVIV